MLNDYMLGGDRFMRVPLLLALLALCFVVYPIQAAATFTVTMTDDLDDGTCAIGGHCSLREAINAANAHPGADTIAFNIPGAGPHTIQPTSELPHWQSIALTKAILLAW
jgi:CSLREA domain-containing protein